MVAFAADYAPTTEAPDAQNRARGIFLAVEVRAGENGVESRFPRREKAGLSYETASGPTNFLNRDPINEPGSQLVRDVKKEGNLDEELNLYAFVGNDPVNRWDYLGLCDSPGCLSCDGGGIGLGEHAGKLECTKTCCQLCSRAAMPKGDGWIEKIRNWYMQHQFIKCGSDTFSYPWGEDPHEDHSTVRCRDIHIPIDMDCSDFIECIKNRDWSDQGGNYGLVMNNCGQFAGNAMIECGAVGISKGFSE